MAMQACFVHARLHLFTYLAPAALPVKGHLLDRSDYARLPISCY